jgi:hypothetical protein
MLCLPKFSRGSLPAVLAVLLALTAPGAYTAFAASGSALLAQQLPRNATLARASVKLLAEAVFKAVNQDPAQAVEILTAAIAAKTDGSGGPIACETVKKLLAAAIGAAPDQASALFEAANASSPDCLDDLNTFLEGLNTAVTGGGYAFGAGLGLQTPGSPGFVGSPPLGGFAVTPVNTAITTENNN